MGPNDPSQLIANALSNEGILTPQTLAYALATVKHETAGTMQPIAEYGGPQQAKKLGYSGGANYYGRGYIQLTHDYNYNAMDKRLGLNGALANNPDLALDPSTSAKILAAYFKDNGVAAAVNNGNLTAARRAINPDNKAPVINGYYNQYLNGAKPTSDNSDLVQKYLNPGTVAGKIGQAIGAINSAVASPVKAYSAAASGIPGAPRSSSVASSGGGGGSSGGGASYTVKPGDTLWGIAQRYTGSGSNWTSLGGYSGSPNKLPVGTKITIPTVVKKK